MNWHESSTNLDFAQGRAGVDEGKWTDLPELLENFCRDNISRYQQDGKLKNFLI